jgi:hypothetical protein
MKVIVKGGGENNPQPKAKRNTMRRLDGVARKASMKISAKRKYHK